MGIRPLWVGDGALGAVVVGVEVEVEVEVVEVDVVELLLVVVTTSGASTQYDQPTVIVQLLPKDGFCTNSVS